MSRNNNYQPIEDIASSIPSSTKDFLRTQQKDIVCGDCGGISATKVQHLLSTLEGTTQLFDTTPLSHSKRKPNSIRQKKPNRSISINKKQKSARNNSQNKSLRRTTKKKINTTKRLNHSNKQQKLSNKNLSSRNNNNQNRLKPKTSHGKNKPKLNKLR